MKDDVKYSKIIVKQEAFQCQGCGTCCMSPVSLFLSKVDIEKIETLGYKQFHKPIKILFRDRWTKEEKEVDRTVMRAEWGYCFFLDIHTKRCEIYNSRPEICRLFPFTKLGVDDEGKIVLASAHKMCVGLGHGDMIDRKKIIDLLHNTLSREYVLWGDILKIHNYEELKDS